MSSPDDGGVASLAALLAANLPRQLVRMQTLDMIEEQHGLTVHDLLLMVEERESASAIPCKDGALYWQHKVGTLNAKITELEAARQEWWRAALKAHDTLDAIGALHKPTNWGMCVECENPWPCLTQQAIHSPDRLRVV